jgi:WD40 repeat protein/serine/threonine protein kinase
MRHGNGTPAAPPSDEGVARALEEYLAAAEAGAAPPREEFLARYPELAEYLDACLAALQFIGRAAEGPRSVAAGLAEAEPLEQTAGRLGEFRILREVGRGGMGVVYEAEQVSLSRRVALKVLPFAAAMDSRQLQRFHNEARAAAGLHHSHIVPVYGVGCERGIHYYAMQFIDGQTLAALIRQLGRPAAPKTAPAGDATVAHVPAPGGDEAEAEVETPLAAALSTDRAGRGREYYRTVARWGVQAAEALDYAHQVGVVHRDVKPANLMVEGRGQLWVTDFGLARIQSDASLTATGDLVGTLRYMSPEQALAKRVPIDHRTDVYSLGATLYELLALRPVFGGSDRQEALRQIAFEEPVPPRRLDRAVPAELEIIVLKALEKNPQDRYATAQELADDLRRFLDEKPIQARPPSIWQRVVKWGRRHRPVVGAAATVLVVLVVALTVSTLLVSGAYRAEATQRHQAEQQEQLAREAEGKETTQRQLAQRQRDAARQLLYVADMQRAQRAWEDGDIGRLQELLEGHRPQAEEPDLRGWEWYYLQALCHRDLFTLREDSDPLEGHGAYLAPRILWSPDGERLAWWTGWTGWEASAVRIWDLRTRQPALTLRGETRSIRSVAWNPDGKRLAILGNDIKVWDAETGQPILTLPPQAGETAEDLAWSPDGSRLAWLFRTLRGHQIRIWDLNARREERLLDGLPNENRGGNHPPLAWSPDGKHLAFARGDGIMVWTLAAHQESPVLIDRAFGYSIPDWLAWSPDSHFLAWAEEQPANTWRIQIWDVAGRRERCDFPARLHAPGAWSPDGKRFASVDVRMRLVKVWDPSTGQETATYRGHTGLVTCVAWSPDGKRLASAGGDLTIKFWDTTAPQEYLALSGAAAAEGSDGSPRLAWRADGKDLGLTWHGTQATVKTWEDLTAPARVVQLPEPETITCLARSPDGRLLASTEKGNLSIRDSATGQILHTCPLTLPGFFQGTDLVSRGLDNRLIISSFHAPQLTWSPDNRHLLVWGNDQDMLVWDAAKGKEEVHVVAGSPAFGGKYAGASRTISLVWSPDGRWIAGATNKGIIRTWDTSTWQEDFPLAGAGSADPNPSPAVGCDIVWSPDSKRLAQGGVKGITIWDVTTRQVVRELRTPGGIVGVSAWSPDGKRLLSNGKLLDLATGQEVFTLALPFGGYLYLWSPDGRRLAGRNGNTVYVRDASAGYQAVPQPPSPDDGGSERLREALRARNLANVLRDTQRPAGAEDAYRRSLAIQQALVGDYPSRLIYRESLADTHLELALLYVAAHRFADAAAAYDACGALLEGLPNLTDREREDELGRAYYGLGDQLRQLGLLPEAKQQYEQAIRWLLPMFSGSPPKQRISLGDLGLLRDLGHLKDIAWFLANCPDAQLRDPAGAVKLAQTVVELFPTRDDWWRTLGVARYRAADWKAAVEALEKFMALRQGGDLGVAENLDVLAVLTKYAALLQVGDSCSFFFLAMSHWQLGEKEQAQEWYARAVSRMEANNPKNEELLRYRSEAEELLGVKHRSARSDEEGASRKDSDDSFDKFLRLGISLRVQGQLEKSVAGLREAVRSGPEHAHNHLSLGMILWAQGHFEDAVAELKRGHELGSRQLEWNFPSAQWVRVAERLVELDAQLPELLKGEAQPANAGECLGLAVLCQMYKELYAASARWYGEAFAAQAALADDLDSGHRYNAACAAALAGCGQGNDAEGLGDEERARLRRQALDWLRADLQAWGRLLDKDPGKGPAAVQTLHHWLEDPDFAGVRGAEAVARLPETDRADWEKLWQEVEALRQRAAGPPK